MGRLLELRTLMNRADVDHQRPAGELDFQGSEEGGRRFEDDAEEIGRLVRGHWEDWGGKEGRRSRGRKVGESRMATRTHSSDGAGWTQGFPNNPLCGPLRRGQHTGAAVLGNPVPWTLSSFRL